MRRLIGLLYERRDYVSLVLAIAISLYLLFSNNTKEIQILRGKANEVFAVIYSPVEWVRGINVLRRENELLKERVVQLRLLNSSLLNYKYENQKLRDMLKLKRQVTLNLVPAKVISKGISPRVNSITIDAGKDDGIEPNTAVLGIDGVVGKTVTVADRTSLIQIMPDYNFRVSVKLEESGTTGILRWREGDVFEVWEIPKTVNVSIGERVLTSGYSDIFPQNLPVGEVTGIVDKKVMLHKIIVAKAYTDFAALEYVFVVRKSER